MPQISLDWDTVKNAYPMRPLTGALKTFMDQTPGTPCCVQMSHALGVAGCTIGPMSNRRRNSVITTPTGMRNYLLAVDEMKWFLGQNFGVGDEISQDDNGNRRSNSVITTPTGMRNYLLAVDEMKWFLGQNFGVGDEISQDDNGNRRS